MSDETPTCPRGHRLAAPNLRRRSGGDGRPECLACRRGWQTVRRARERYGLVLDIQIESNKHYAKIMAAGR